MVEETDDIYYDEEKAIDYILSNMPDLDCRRDDILSVIDSIFDFFCSEAFVFRNEEPDLMAIIDKIPSKIYRSCYHTIGFWIEYIEPEGNIHN